MTTALTKNVAIASIAYVCMKREGILSTAIVSHGNFIRALTGIKPQNCEIIQFNNS